jgi:hypothetical protein
MTDPIILADHAGIWLTHGKPKVNGVEIHYAIGGAAGEAGPGCCHAARN